ncbi:MAG: hypothetical protein KDD04_09960, partial [Sinomicrobium sp.]|nr:hypothetical protein [Sinomicrobium sp.]
IGWQLNHFNLTAGPEVEYLFEVITKFPDHKSNNSFLVNKKWILNANLEAGYRIGRFQIGLRGSMGLTPVVDLEFTDVNGVHFASKRIINLALQAAVNYTILER